VGRRSLRLARVVRGVLVASLMLTMPHVALADGDDARTLYETAARAYEAKDFAMAAKSFARADALKPNALALKLALASALQADDPVLAEELALHAEQRDSSADVQDLARSAHRMAKGRVGKVKIACASPPTCVAEVAERRARDGEIVVVKRGRVEVRFTAASGRVSTVALDAGDGEVLAREAPDPSVAPTAAPPSAQKAPTGLSPVFFFVGVGVTAALGGVTAVSGIDANAKYDDFATHRTVETRDPAKSAELRTNVLLGGAIVAALATGGLALWFTRWGSSRRTEAGMR
jgi:hypothetical protein